MLARLCPLLVAAGIAHALTTMQQAGMRVIYSYPGVAVPQSLLDNISAGYAGGVIFFGENVGSNFSAVVQQLVDANKKSPTGLPLLLMTDQEGGQVRRLPGEPVMSAKQIGQAGIPANAATSAGAGCGDNMKSYGLNVNLAPVLGVYRSSGDFLDKYQRSFGNSASLVSTCIGKFITAQQQKGVAATAKHFPGLGAATSSQNTDASPVTITLPLSTLQSVDEVPYKTAIANGVKLVMTSWAVYSGSPDANRPAGLSTYWIQTVLRGNLGFKGVTVSDAIEAGALSAYGSDSARSISAMSAGLDLILASGRDASQGSTIVSAVTKALADGTISASANSAAISRITSLRQSFA